jgi:hypothetical protein
MKLVREHINEKFAEDSDPIKDMGIGITGPKKFYNKKELVDHIIHALPLICNSETIPEDILYSIERNDILPVNLFYEIINFLEEHNQVMISKDKNYTSVNYEHASAFDFNFSRWTVDLRDRLLEMGYEQKHKIIKEHINEKFTDDSDPIRDLRIGAFKRKMTFTDKDEYISTLLSLLPLILGTKEIPKDIIASSNNYIFSPYYHTISAYVGNYFTFEDSKNVKAFHDIEWCFLLRTELRRMGFEHFTYNEDLKLNVNEKFSGDSDPITDMGIGTIGAIRNFCKPYINHMGKSGRQHKFNLDVIDDLLLMCIKAKNHEYAKYLLDHGADVHYDGPSSTPGLEIPLRYAFFYNDIKMIDLLMKYGADIKKSIYDNELDIGSHNTQGFRKTTIKHVLNILHGKIYK